MNPLISKLCTKVWVINKNYPNGISYSRLYSSNLTILKPVKLMVNLRLNDGICCCSFSSLTIGQGRTRSNPVRQVNSLESSIIKRKFSLKDSLESAIMTHSSIFKSLSESAIVEKAYNFVVQLHDSSGLSWWMSIIMTTCLLRGVIVLPIALYQNYVIAKLENVKVEMDKIVNDIKYDLNREIRKNGWSEKTARRHYNLAVRKEYNRLILRDNCHPAKCYVLGLIQIPLWVILSTTFRNLVYEMPYNDAKAHLKYLELSVGGVAWFPDLTTPDSFFLPIMLGLSSLAIIEVQTMMYKGKRSKVQRFATNFFRGFALFIIPVAATVPSCLTLYWTTSTTIGLCQNLALMSPRVRRLVGIPTTPSSHTHPYSHLAEQLSNKFRK